MMTEQQQTGHAGEDMALSYLLKNGYTILDSNWRFGHLEVDLIALDHHTLVFIEVKTRSTDIFVSPIKAVHRQKQQNIIRAANTYLLKHHYTYEVRFDIIAILKTNKETRLEHLKDAYSPQW